MSDRAALLRAILDAPEDDAPRLIFADWLDENGEGERAAWIRVQVALGRKSQSNHSGCDTPESRGELNGYPVLHSCGQCPRCKLTARERELWDIGTDAGGFLELPGWMYPHTWRRGFLDFLTCTASDWLAHADAILSEHPIRSVRLTTTPEVEYDGDLRLAGGRWFGLDETAAESRRLHRIEPPTVEAHGYWQHDAHILCRLRWPGIEFELPSDPQGGFPIPRHLAPAFEELIRQAAAADRAEELLILSGDPSHPRPMGVINYPG